MLAELKKNLKAEISVFKAAHALELQKRPVILSADGPVLQGLSAESEKIFLELNRLEDLRLGFMAGIFEGEKNLKPLTLKEMVQSSLIQESPMSTEFETLAENYRTTALALHEETRENQRLLEFTRFRIKSFDYRPERYCL